MIPMMVFLKVTSRCNLSCPFCYSEKADENFIEDLPPRELATILKEKFFKPFSTLGCSFQVVFHGGEFTLYDFKKLEVLVYQLREECPNITIFSAMTNLQSRQVSSNLYRYSPLGIHLSTSFNRAVFSKRWLENAKKLYSLQKCLHINQVIETPDELSSKSFNKTVEMLKEAVGSGVVFKRERLVSSTSPSLLCRDEYSLASEMMIHLFERVIAEKDAPFYSNIAPMLFPSLAFAYAYRTKIFMPIRGALCTPFCAFSTVVINSDLSLSLCTKAYKQTKFASLLDTDVDDITEKYFRFSEDFLLKHRNFSKSCYSCRYSALCLGVCPFVVPEDNSGECAQCRNTVDYLVDMEEDKFNILLQKSVYFINSILQAKKTLAPFYFDHDSVLVGS